MLGLLTLEKLNDEVLELGERVEALERRLEALESKIGMKNPVEDDPPAESGRELEVTFEQARCQLDFLESPKGRYAVVNEVFVPPEHRREGLATALLQKAVRIAEENGCYKVLCWSRFSNSIAHKLYEKVGFSKRGYEFRLDLKA